MIAAARETKNELRNVRNRTFLGDKKRRPSRVSPLFLAKLGCRGWECQHYWAQFRCAHVGGFPKYQATKLGMDFATCGTFSDIYRKKKQSGQDLFYEIHLIDRLPPVPGSAEIGSFSWNNFRERVFATLISFSLPSFSLPCRLKAF